MPGVGQIFLKNVSRKIQAQFQFSKKVKNLKHNLKIIEITLQSYELNLNLM